MRAAVFGRVSIMLPMISGIEEIRLAKGIIDKVKKELIDENVNFKNDVPVGVMVEVPSLALIADIAAKEVDFFNFSNIHWLLIEEIQMYLIYTGQPTWLF